MTNRGAKNILLLQAWNEHVLVNLYSNQNTEIHHSTTGARDVAEDPMECTREGFQCTHWTHPMIKIGFLHCCAELMIWWPHVGKTMLGELQGGLKNGCCSTQQDMLSRKLACGDLSSPVLQNGPKTCDCSWSSGLTMMMHDNVEYDAYDRWCIWRRSIYSNEESSFTMLWRILRVQCCNLYCSAYEGSTIDKRILQSKPRLSLFTSQITIGTVRNGIKEHRRS